MICIGAFLIAFVFAYWQSDILIVIVLRPLKEAAPTMKLATLSLTEGFMTTMKIALYAALVMTLPVIGWQLWRFVEPGLLPRERRWTKNLVFPIMASFFAGTAFCYYVILPIAVNFFLTDLGNTFTPVFSYGAYVDFTVVFLLAMGIMFQLPLLIALLDAIGIMPVEILRSHRRHAIVVAFILGAIFSPPDVISQTLVSLPLIALLEIGIMLADFFRRHRNNEDLSDTDKQNMEEMGS
ncbi:MAG: twin-arginine translocase subunit TatC [Candidatus Riflebacteria bacterium]|nr:twin-arginine translocase subunit TatC [Candidatus Riflebacteria bacterium]